MQEYIIISLDSKTLKCLEESANGEVPSKESKNKISQFYWGFDIEFRMRIQDMIELHHRVGGEFAPGHLAKLREYTNSGIVEAIFSRKPEYKIGHGYFRVYPITA